MAKNLAPKHFFKLGANSSFSVVKFWKSMRTLPTVFLWKKYCERWILTGKKWNFPFRKYCKKIEFSFLKILMPPRYSKHCQCQPVTICFHKNTPDIVSIQFHHFVFHNNTLGRLPLDLQKKLKIEFAQTFIFLLSQRTLHIVHTDL